MRALLGEPTFHFALLALGIFALHAWFGPNADDAVAVTPQLIEARRAALTKQLGKPPTQGQLDAEIDRYIDEEVLRREAVRLGLDRDDVIVRRRLVQKMTYLLEEQHPTSEPTRTELQAWLDAEPNRYTVPAQFTFEHVFFAEPIDTAPILEALASGASPSGFGDAFVHGRRVRGRSEADVSRMFGDAFAVALSRAPTDSWMGPVGSALGTHLVRVETYSPSRTATLDEALSQLTADWKQAAIERARAEALDSLRAEYVVRYPDGSP